MNPAEPRQPAQKTDLEFFLRVRGPELLRQHAANIVLVVMVLIAAGMFLYSRSRNKALFAQAANQNTAVAYDLAMQVRSMLESPATSPEAVQERVKQALNAAALVVDSDATPAEKAAAQLARGEVFWSLANAPEQSVAATQPVMGFQSKSSDGFLTDAEAAYTEILSKYADQKDAVANALLGLAAISENRRDFAKASEWYGRVTADSALRSEYQRIAKSRLTMLDDLKKPYALAKPTSQPATTEPTATQPTTTP